MRFAANSVSSFHDNRKPTEYSSEQGIRQESHRIRRLRISFKRRKKESMFEHRLNV